MSVGKDVRVMNSGQGSNTHRGVRSRTGVLETERPHRVKDRLAGVAAIG